jgi:hypothetical protein
VKEVISSWEKKAISSWAKKSSPKVWRELRSRVERTSARCSGLPRSGCSRCVEYGPEARSTKGLTSRWRPSVLHLGGKSYFKLGEKVILSRVRNIFHCGRKRLFRVGWKKPLSCLKNIFDSHSIHKFLFSFSGRRIFSHLLFVLWDKHLLISDLHTKLSPETAYSMWINPD